MKNLTLILIALSFCAINLHAQNVKSATISWSSTNTMDVSLGDNSSEITTLTSIGTTKIEWRNQSGSILKTFQVIEVVGDWNNVSVNGSIIYEVTDGTNSGTITFRKDSEGTRVLMVIVSDPVKITELSIQSFQVQ